MRLFEISKLKNDEHARASECWQHYNQKEQSFLATQQRLAPQYGHNLRLSLIGQDVIEAHATQWHPLIQSETDYRDDRYLSKRSLEKAFETTSDTIPGKFLNPDYDARHFNLAIWMGDTLCGIATGGHPDSNHPLKGQISKIIKEAALDYAASINIDKIAYMGPFSEGFNKSHKTAGLQKGSIQLKGGSTTSDVYIHPVTPNPSLAAHPPPPPEPF